MPTSSPFDSHRAALIAGLRNTIPMLVGAIPFGLLFGALATTAGLSLWTTMAISALVFAGSAQFIAVGLFAQGTTAALIVLTTFIVNLRHALYAASLLPYLRHLPQRWLAPLAFTLTDETYAVTIKQFHEHPGDPRRHIFQLGSSLGMYTNWQLCTFIGAVAGARIQSVGDLGLEIAMAVTFIGIVVPLLNNLPMIISALAAGVIAISLSELPHQLGLFLGALAGVAVGFALETWSRKSERHRT